MKNKEGKLYYPPLKFIEITLNPRELYKTVKSIPSQIIIKLT